MTDPTHFHNFAPADAVQWTGTDDGFDIVAEHLADQGFDLAQSGDMLAIWTADMLTELHRLRPGQWLVRQGDKVWVQDDEPAKVVKWDEGDFMACPDIDACEESTDSSPPTCDHGTVQERRPVLSNGWTGPWSPVEGGAE